MVVPIVMNEVAEETIVVVERLRLVSGGDGEAARKIARLFLELTEDRLVKLRGPIDGDDLTTVEQQLHTIRVRQATLGQTSCQSSRPTLRSRSAAVLKTSSRRLSAASECI